MRNTRVLVVDDELGIRESLCGVLEDEGYLCASVESGELCIEELKRQVYDVVLLDVWLEGMDGLETLARVQEIPLTERPEVVIISGHGTIETAVRATKLGAFDFLEKPLTIEKVVVVINNAVQQRRLEIEINRLRGTGDAKLRIIGESVPMKALRQQLTLMAATNGRVLIFGESGTGKELIAHAIHAASVRADEPFVEVNCAAIPEELIESELFGHRKASFAGAAEDKQGKLHKADGGTLFLDEVGDMSLKTQAKVLRALDEQRFEPVGASESIQVDVRVVASTNKNLEEEIERGNFREDLFYRLNVIPFYVPPLRERIEDVRLLADYFLREFTTAYGRKPKDLTEEAFRALEEYPWPGNVRELRNLMERIVIMNPQVRIEARHIPLDRSRRAVFDRPMERFGSLQEVREAAERDYILKKLEDAKGNITRTAELLGLERSHLYRKMKALGIVLKENLMQRPSLAALTAVFFKVGNTTFGGGPPTMAALQREFVDRHEWLSQEDYGLSFALARVTPGTNVMAFCAATGWQILGWAGAIMGTLSVTLPSAVIAVLITVGYENWRTNTLALAAINGTVAAVAGMMLATVYTLVKPHMTAQGSGLFGSHRLSFVRSVRALTISGGAFIALWKFGLSPLQIIGIALVIGLIWQDPADRQPSTGDDPQLPAQERASN